MKKAFILLFVSLVGGMSIAQAQQKKKQSLHDQFTGQGYGTAGCGLGSIVFGEKPGMVQIFAATTNSYGGQTFAISSGTSNCGESGKSAQVQEFIETNKVALEKDLARGQGETLSSLAQVMNCQNPTFSTQIRQNYVTNFPQGGASSQQIEAVAAQSCGI